MLQELSLYSDVCVFVKYLFILFICMFTICVTLCSLRVVCFSYCLFVLLYDINPPHALANKYAKQIKQKTHQQNTQQQL